MSDQERCRQQILSEEYRDFIIRKGRETVAEQEAREYGCSVDAGFGYQCAYLPEKRADPISRERYSYNAIPRCYTILGMEELNQSGILPLQNYPTLQLSGKQIMIGFIDTGIDYTNSVFRNLDGSTRIEGIWDQTDQSGRSPEKLEYGSVYTKDEINEALRQKNPLLQVPTADENGHGTFVASVACGGADAEEQFLGAAPEAAIGVVKLKPAKRYLKEFYFIREDAVCYQENDIILGMRYLQELAVRVGMPLVFCIALGSNMGGHTGNTPLPVLMRAYSGLGNRVFAVGTGNEANQRHHYQGKLTSEAETKEVDIRVGENCRGFSMELWTELPNVMAVSLVSPSGEVTSVFSPRTGNSTTFSFLLDRTKAYLEYRLPAENTSSELIAFRFQDPIPGIWRLQVQASRISDGNFHIWLPVTEFLNTEVYFLESNPDVTLTTPAEVWEAVTVAYYDGRNQSIGISSGRGFTRNQQIKPDITAPGIAVEGVLPGNRYVNRSGSSAAAGITAGAVALLMEWLVYQLGTLSVDALVVKSLLILGARREKEIDYPSREWGYGIMDLYNVFEQVRRF